MAKTKTDAGAAKAAKGKAASAAEEKPKRKAAPKAAAPPEHAEAELLPAAQAGGDFSVVGACCRITRTSLTLAENASFDQYQAALSSLCAVEGGIKWLLGDLMNQGEQRYGEAYSQAMDATGMAYQTIANAKWVSAAVPPENRRESLSFTHHIAIANLPPREQAKWLDKAEQEHWSAAELRSAVMESNGKERATRKPPVPISEAVAAEVIAGLTAEELAAARPELVAELANLPQQPSGQPTPKGKADAPAAALGPAEVLDVGELVGKGLDAAQRIREAQKALAVIHEAALDLLNLYREFEGGTVIELLKQSGAHFARLAAAIAKGKAVKK